MAKLETKVKNNNNHLYIMNKIKYGILLASVVMTNIMNAFAESGTCGENLTWNLSKGVLTISGSGEMEDYFQWDLWSYDTPWWEYNESINEIIITDGVTRIGDNAFISCTNLLSVTIPNSVTSIGEYAFAHCENMSSITIPSQTIRLGDFALSECYNLISVFIPGATKELGSGVFSACPSLETIEVAHDNPSYSSSQGVLYNKEGTILIQCPARKQGAFTIPDGIQIINDYAFYGCMYLTSVTIPHGTTLIGERAFTHCYKLTSINMPNSLSAIGESAFYYCKSLTSVIIPNGVTSIGEWAFGNCYNLIAVTLPSSVSSIGNNAFIYTYNLEEITVAPNNLNYCSIDGVLFNKEKTILINYPLGKNSSSYIIPNTVTRIAGSAFSYCKMLSSITIPNSVTNINDNAFSSCSNLKTITIPNGVESIGSFAFAHCENLTSVSISESVTFIGEAPFYNCRRLSSINVSQNNLEICSIDGIVYSKDMKWLLDYPAGKQNVSYALPNCIDTIGAYAFNGNRYLTSVTIPDNVTTILERAFEDCTSMEYIALPRNIKDVEYYSFMGCDSLKKFYYPKNFDIESIYVISADTIAYDPEFPPTLPQVLPPFLVLEEESLIFSDSTGNNSIDAEENCSIQFRIKNIGKGNANNCEAKVHISGASNGISINNVELPTISVGKSQKISIPISAGMNTIDGVVTISIEVFEPSGWGVAPFSMNVTTKSYDPPCVQIADYSITSESGMIKKMSPFNVILNLQNTKYGVAKDVKLNIKLPDNIYIMDGSCELFFPLINSGEVIPIQLTLAANNNYPSTNIPVIVDIKEKYGKYAMNKQIDIALNQTTSTNVNIAAISTPKPREIELAMMSSDVDRDIPISSTQNDNTIVLIIANEHYESMPVVPYAINDGNVFKEYCIKTLGIPQENIMYQSDATLNGFRRMVDLLQKKVQVRTQVGRETNVILFYTGHGMPDVNTQSAFLMPVDGFDENVTTGYKLDYLYQLLGQMQAKTITVFIDACFSGVNRNDKALAIHKGARLTAKSGAPTGNMVIFAASQGNQTASVNDKEKHGLFTYCLLKKLKATEGDVSLSDLANYLIGEVNMKSLDLFEKEQIPSVVASPEVENQWRNWKLK